MIGRWNDKTAQLFDAFLNEIHSGSIYSEVEYELYDDNGKKHTFSGVWVLVDNGYLQWTCTIPPMKDPIYIKDKRWSKWMESMRKDVECTFGILKGRWRILKTGIRLHEVTACDNIWKTCCALHNYLLEVDGLSKKWTRGITKAYFPSDYEGELGQHDVSDITHTVPYGEDGIGDCTLDLSGMGPGDIELEFTGDFGKDSGDDPTSGDGDEAKPIRTLSFQNFRHKLINHWTHRFINHQVQWPSRTGIGEPKFFN
jgi:hypothetical protein